MISLPDELWLEIMKLVSRDIKDFQSCTLVNKYFYQICTDAEIINHAILHAKGVYFTIREILKSKQDARLNMFCSKIDSISINSWIDMDVIKSFPKMYWILLENSNSGNANDIKNVFELLLKTVFEPESTTNVLSSINSSTVYLVFLLCAYWNLDLIIVKLFHVKYLRTQEILITAMRVSVHRQNLETSNSILKAYKGQGFYETFMEQMNSLFQSACHFGNIPLIRIFLENGMDEVGISQAFTFSSEIGHLEIVKLLYLHGADVNFQKNKVYIDYI